MFFDKVAAWEFCPFLFSHCLKSFGLLGKRLPEIFGGYFILENTQIYTSQKQFNDKEVSEAFAWSCSVKKLPSRLKEIPVFNIPVGHKTSVECA